MRVTAQDPWAHLGEERGPLLPYDGWPINGFVPFFSSHHHRRPKSADLFCVQSPSQPAGFLDRLFKQSIPPSSFSLFPVCFFSHSLSLNSDFIFLFLSSAYPFLFWTIAITVLCYLVVNLCILAEETWHFWAYES